MADLPVQDAGLDSAASAIEALLSRPGGTSDPADPDTNSASQSAIAPASEATPAAESTPIADSADKEPSASSEAEPQAQPTPKPDAPEAQEAKAKIREAEQATRESTAARDRYLDQLNSLIPQFQASLRGDFADIRTEDDQIALAEKDPDRYNRYVIAQMKLQRAVKSQNELAAQKFQEWQKTEKVKLQDLLPDLKDPDSDKAKKLAADILGYAKKQGYTDHQIAMAGATDIHTFHKAMLWERGESQRAAAKAEETKKLEDAKKKASGAPPVQRPGVGRADAGKQEKVQEDFKRLQKTGRLDDAAKVISNILG